MRRMIGLKPRTTAPVAIPESMQKKKKIKNLDGIIAEAEKMSKKYADKYICITDADELKQYIDKCIENKRVAIDTETTGLDIFNDQVVGFSMYTEGLKACYVPLKHISRNTGQIDRRQLPVEYCAEQLDRLNGVDGLEIDWFNAQFDLNMLWYSMHVKLWDIPGNDGGLMHRMLDTERSKDNNLKALHADFCAHSTRGPRFNDLFPAGSFNVCPYQFATAYAARDAEMTWEFVDYCYSQMRLEGNEDLLKAWLDIERPLIPVLLRMREKGILVDQSLKAQLTAKYQAKLDEAERDFMKEYEPYLPQINSWRTRYAKVKGKNLDLPIKIDSNDQLAILFWDIMKLTHEEGAKLDKDSIKATDSEIGRALLRYREAKKLLSTYLTGLDKFLQKDGCVHGGIKQLGAETGRTSAYDPNLQNIPSHNREIRQMYIARPNCYLISCDYSAQEPRLTACIANDEGMIKAYQEGKDLYAMIAATAYNTTYEECLEKRNGELYLEGKERRSSAKSIVLGICYGRHIKSIAEQLKCTVEEAQTIYDKVTKNYPGLLKAQDEAIAEAHRFGYVKTLWGFRRKLSIMMHDDYELFYKPGANPEFDPYEPVQSVLAGNTVNPATTRQYVKRLEKCKYRKDKEKILQELDAMGIELHDYSYQKQDMARKTLNAKIQGSAAQMSKLAMIAMDKDERLKKIDTYLLLMIHDEVICECPKQHLAEAIQYIKEDMVLPTKNLPIPFLSDAEPSEKWYGPEVTIDDSGEIVED